MKNARKLINRQFSMALTLLRGLYMRKCSIGSDLRKQQALFQPQIVSRACP
jgi:hypothetical protein